MPTPDDRRKPFRLALSLTGGTSTGAYVAGAIDFIVEALDAFQAAKRTDDAGGELVPPHDVSIEALCGASSGALTCAVTASALRFAFEPATCDADRVTCDQNPLFDSWINMTGIAELLGTKDRHPSPLLSLLDSTSLDRSTRKTMTFGTGRVFAQRDWIADPLRVCLSVTNLEGVPFALSSTDAAGAPQSVLHADVMRFNVCGLGTTSSEKSRPGETQLLFPRAPGEARSAAWAAFGEAALASAAFPVVFASRTITRPKSDYSGFQVVFPSEKGRAAAALGMTPDLSRARGSDLTFTAADGGIVDNSPVDLARAALNGAGSPVHDDGDRDTDRAILMIDPLLASRPSSRPPSSAFPFLSNLGPLINALIDQARFRPDEVALAQDPKVFSRFLIAPTTDQGKTYGGQHLAGASCHAFGGYLADEFREHDFFLGRCNAQAYLANDLTLPQEHPLFDGWREHPLRGQWLERFANEQGELPIIPLIDRLHPRSHRIAIPDWPTGKADLDAAGRLLDDRLDLIHEKLQSAWQPATFIARTAKLVQRLFWSSIRGQLRKRLIGQIGTLLVEHRLK